MKRLIDELAREFQITVITPAYKNVSGQVSDRPKVLATRYASAKFQILCHAPGGIPAALESNKVLIMTVPFLLLALFFKTLLNARNADIMHANWAICGAVAGIAALLTRTPLITTLRGDDVNSAQKSFISRLFLSTTIMFSKTLVTISDDIREQLVRDFNITEGKVVTIPNGVNSAFIAVGQQAPTSKDRQKLTIVAVGSLIPRKNVSFLIKALSRLPTHVELTVVGDGEEKESLVELSKTLGLEGRVHFLGAINPAAMPAILASHDVFVIASYSEGRSNAVYEAMACGKAIIASDIPGTREQIANDITGYLFPPGSENDFVELLKKLDQDRDLIGAIGANAHQWIVENGFTWQTAKNNYAAVFHDLLAAGR